MTEQTEFRHDMPYSRYNYLRIIRIFPQLNFVLPQNLTDSGHPGFVESIINTGQRWYRILFWWSHFRDRWLSLCLFVDDSSMRHWYRQFSAADFVGTLLNVSCRLQKNIHKKAWAKWWVSKKCSFAPTGRYIFRLLDAKCKTYKGNSRKYL